MMRLLLITCDFSRITDGLRRMYVACSRLATSIVSTSSPLQYRYKQAQILWLWHPICNTVYYASPYLTWDPHPCFLDTVCLGKSGLKVSRIILGCMSYGSPEWQPWVLDEIAGLEHIKAAYEAGINVRDLIWSPSTIIDWTCLYRPLIPLMFIVTVTRR